MKKPNASTNRREEQVNVRLTREEIEDLDAWRIAMRKERGSIPSRSELIREALLRNLELARKRKKG